MVLTNFGGNYGDQNLENIPFLKNLNKELYLEWGYRLSLLGILQYWSFSIYTMAILENFS